MERPPEIPAAFVSCQQSAVSGRLTPNAGHLPLNGSAPWAAGTGSSPDSPYDVEVRDITKNLRNEVTEGPVSLTFGIRHLIPTPQGRSQAPLPDFRFSIRPLQGRKQAPDALAALSVAYGVAGDQPQGWWWVSSPLGCVFLQKQLLWQMVSFCVGRKRSSAAFHPAASSIRFSMAKAFSSLASVGYRALRLKSRLY